MKGLMTGSACELIKGNKKEVWASSRKSSYSSNFFSGLSLERTSVMKASFSSASLPLQRGLHQHLPVATRS
jgi:hypothetical protein